MIVFGDSEPEDAWDALDPPVEQIANIGQRVELLTRQRVRTGATNPLDTLDAFAQLVRQARRRRLHGAEVVRADLIDVDIAYVRGRLT